MEVSLVTGLQCRRPLSHVRGLAGVYSDEPAKVARLQYDSLRLRVSGGRTAFLLHSPLSEWSEFYDTFTPGGGEEITSNASPLWVRSANDSYLCHSYVHGDPSLGLTGFYRVLALVLDVSGAAGQDTVFANGTWYLMGNVSGWRYPGGTPNRFTMGMWLDTTLGGIGQYHLWIACRVQQPQPGGTWSNYRMYWWRSAEGGTAGYFSGYIDQEQDYLSGCGIPPFARYGWMRGVSFAADAGVIHAKLAGTQDWW